MLVPVLEGLEEGCGTGTQALLDVEQFNAPNHRRSRPQELLASRQNQLLGCSHVDLDVSEAGRLGEAIEPPRLHAGAQAVAGIQAHQTITVIKG